MSDYKEYDIDISPGRITVSEHQSSAGLVIGIIIFALIVAGISSLFGSNKYDPAANNPDYQYEHIDTSVPQNLTNTKALGTEWGSGTGNYYNEKISDKDGNTFDGYLDLCACNSTVASLNSEGYVTYDLRGNWKHLSGAFFPRDWENGDYKVKLTIYADDAVVYDGPWTGLNDSIRYFDVDLHNCQTVKLSVTNQQHDQIPFITPGLEVVNATLYN